MQDARSGAASAAFCTFIVFLAPALLAPGDFELANVAGVAVAVWAASLVWRLYGRQDIAATFPFRIRPVAPGLVMASALLFAAVLVQGWSPGGEGMVPALEAFWRFPFSPVGMFAAEASGLASPTPLAARLILMAATAALVVGGIIAALAFFGGIDRRDTLYRHALIWKGVTMRDGETLLAERGARGLKPITDEFAKTDHGPVRGRIYLRASSYLIAAIMLAYGPVFCRIAAASRIPVLEGFFGNRIFETEFFLIWIAGLWGLSIAAAIILFGAYFRLALSLDRR